MGFRAAQFALPGPATDALARWPSRQVEVTGQRVRGRLWRGVTLASAATAAARAFPAWRDTPPLRRARVLMRFRELLEANKEALARLVSEEHGKTLENAIAATSNAKPTCSPRSRIRPFRASTTTSLSCSRR